MFCRGEGPGLKQEPIAILGSGGMPPPENLEFLTLYEYFWGFFLSCKTDWKLKYKHLENEGARGARLPAFSQSEWLEAPLPPYFPIYNNIMLCERLIASIFYMHTHIMHLKCSQWLWLWYWELNVIDVLGALHCIVAAPMDINYQWARELWLAHEFMSIICQKPQTDQWKIWWNSNSYEINNPSLAHSKRLSPTPPPRVWNMMASNSIYTNVSFCVMQAGRKGWGRGYIYYCFTSITHPLGSWLMIARTFCTIHVHLSILCAWASLWAWHSSSPVQCSTPVVHSTVPVGRFTPANSHSRV